MMGPEGKEGLDASIGESRSWGIVSSVEVAAI
jgi:hypothetical protein